MSDHPDFQQGARAAAATHIVVARGCGEVPLAAKSSTTLRYLRSVREHLASSAPLYGEDERARQWLLDNHYVVERQVRQVANDLPSGFVRRLPSLGDSGREQCTRVEALARELVSQAALILDEEIVRRFVAAYQEIAVLTTGELWAVPAMLRVSAIDLLVRALSRMVTAIEPPPIQAEEPEQQLAVPDNEIAVRAIQCLQLLAVVDWQEFFEATSVLERVLRNDPGSSYAQMDFETRDAYRDAVEEIAHGTGLSETEVADSALDRAAHAADERRRHVGYWLVDRGRAELERDLDFRARGFDRLRRRIARNPTTWYLGGIALATLGALGVPALYLAYVEAGMAGWVVGLLVAILPASTLAITLVQWLVTQILPPRVLPKLDLHRGLPDDCKTIVVVPTLAGSTEDVDSLLRGLEVCYLCNPESGLQFGLLTDFLDADTQGVPEDESITDRLRHGVQALNRRYGDEGSGPFHVFHRERRWNMAEGRWMGWERKRGKLEEFNRLLRGARDTSYVLHEGDPDHLEAIRYVITLDTDTELPRGAAVRLVGILAHPLNRAVADPVTGRTVDGYTVIQPRVEIAPESGSCSTFTRLFSGDAGFDIYTRAVSDVYQDLFGEGIFVGKGIYDVDAFQTSLEDRAPENALASHDLFEGVHGRVGLATDVVLYEDYPQHYLAYARRLHRWVRGDWQLLPWLASRVPTRNEVRVPNRLKLIDRWKIFDNLRRSLLAPSLLLFVAVGWLWLPGNPAIWTLAVLLVPAGHVFTTFVSGLARGARRAPIRPWLRGLGQTAREGLGRWLLTIVFLVHEAVAVTDAIVRVLFRMTISKKKMLQWATAAHTSGSLAARGPHAVVWAEMWPGVLVTAGLCAAVATAASASLPVAAPLLATWLLAPELARRISTADTYRPEVISTEGRQLIRRVARRTWLFYETFAGPEDQWLAPDHFQEDPKGVVAHRTSPTNIAMHLLSTQSAYDLGYIGVSELAVRLGNTLHSLRRLERYRGHPFNWYETRRLEPLLPRYVSSVDSGNLAGALLVLRKGCGEVGAMPVLRPEMWDGLRDTLELILDDIERIDASAAAVDLAKVRLAVADLLERVIGARQQPDLWWSIIADHFAHASESFHRNLTTALERSEGGLDLSLVRDLRTWLDRLEHQLTGMRRDIQHLLPWLGLDETPPELSLPGPEVRLDQIAGACRHALNVLERIDSEESNWLRAALSDAQEASVRLSDSLQALVDLADKEFEGMDFSLFYNEERRLLHIGYDVTADRMDPHFYDLLASEARLASYIAIIKGDVPQKHWYALGRPVTRQGRRATLLSWSATMFEYLMPHLVMHSNDRTLLQQSALAAIDRQIEYARSRSVPWGVSESGYYAFDADSNYQYRAFGVPGLGFKRGLSDDLVVAPYASMLALALRPEAVIGNLRALVDLGMEGPYGLYDSIDFTEDRVPAGRRGAIVRSYMAHHQGMGLVAISNLLGANPMARRFHANSLVQSGEILLNEQIPTGVVAEIPQTETGEPGRPGGESPAPLPVWSPPSVSGTPEVHLLSNGRLTTLFTSDGGGGLALDDLAVTRWSPSMGRSDAGYWIYVQDLNSDELWSLGRAPTSSWPVGSRIDLHPHKAEVIRRDHGISLHMEVAVSPADDVEVRDIRVTNETSRIRRIALATAAEPVLDSAREATRHPAFSKLFLESEVLPDSQGILFRRRPRSPTDPSLQMVHRAVYDDPLVSTVETETDKAKFLGRLRSWGAPQALVDGRDGLDGGSGAVIDPVMALRVVVEIPPRVTVRVAFVTAVASSRHEVLQLAKKYGSMHEVDWVLQDAGHASVSRIRESGSLSRSLPAFQQLLSALLYPQRGLRESSATEGQEPCLASQPRLWGYGVSGDFPILLLRVFDGDSALVSETLTAHRYWYANGVKIEVILLNEGGSGYRDEVGERVRSVLSESPSGPALGHRGGLFVVAGDRLSEDERCMLLASASVVLDTRHGDLEAQLRHRRVQPHELPVLPATMPPTQDNAPLPAPEELHFENGLGGFTADGREYVMRIDDDNQTPAPWCNVLANEQFGCVVSESSLGYTWSLNSSEHRITPWYNDPVCDVSGEGLYLRDEETAEVWSTTPSPSGAGSVYTVRHGAGYTEYQHNSHGLDHRLRVFVPWDESAKVVQLRLENHTTRPRRLTLTYYAEWVLGTDRDRTRAFVVPEYSRQEGCLLASCAWTPEFADRVAFLVAEGQPHAFTCDRDEFLGPDGDRAIPAALRRWGLSNEVSPGNDPCAALQIHVDLSPGEVFETHFVLGDAESRTAALELARRLRKSETIKQAWQMLKVRWDDLLGSLSVRTPDPALDLMLNRWWLYQSLAARFLGRTGFFQSSGAYGFRDQLQDIMAYMHAAPDLVRRHILKAAAHQFEEGDVLHWWHPPSDKGVRTRCSDDLLWLPYVTAHYVRCSGDHSILTESVPFLSADPLGPQEPSRYGSFNRGGDATLLEHCRRALDRGFTTGEHGLPLIGDGDWNDGMNRVGSQGRGESVWLAWFVYATVESFVDLLPKTERDEWKRRAEQLRQAIEPVAWDGRWYRRAFHDDGSVVGSASSVECQIDSISQSWAVLSGAAQEDRALSAVNAARKHLVREEDALCLLLEPPFNRTRHDPGYIRAYPPGIRENGGQYTHAATWLGWAFARLGNGSDAARILRLLNPVNHAATRSGVARYRVEPYVLAADVYSVAPHVGRGGWTWYTGAASWAWRLGVEAILGISLQAGDVVIDPCLPREWESYEATLCYEVGELHIIVRNPERVSRGRMSLQLDGEGWDSNVVPRQPGTHEVVVTIRSSKEGSKGTEGCAEPNSVVFPPVEG